MKTKKKVRLWLIKKLNAVPQEHIPVRIQADLLNHWANRTMDKEMADSFYGKSITEI